MSRGSSNGGNIVFLNISGGKVVEEVAPETPGAIKRINKNGREVWERRDDYVEGVITSMYEREKEFNGEHTLETVIRMDGGNESYSIAMKHGNRYWVALASRLPNLDLSKPVKFQPYSFQDKATGRDVIGMNVFQGEQKIAPYWTKENPGDLPQPVQVMYQGKAKLDFYQRDQYLLGVIKHYAGILAEQNESMYGGSDDGEAAAPEAPAPQFQPPAPKAPAPQFQPPAGGRPQPQPKYDHPYNQPAAPQQQHIPDPPGTWAGQPGGKAPF